MDNLLKDMIESLIGRSLNSNDGLDPALILKNESRLGQSLPESLKTFYLLAGKLVIFTDAFEHFIHPDNLECIDGMLVFLEENQGVCYWGIPFSEKTDKNDSVYMCTDLKKEPLEWHSENVSLKTFLEIILYYQCAQGGYEYCGSVYEEGFDNRNEYEKFLGNIIKGWEKVVDHNGLVIYQHGNQLIWHFVDPNGATANMIYASALKKEDFDTLESYGFYEL